MTQRTVATAALVMLLGACQGDRGEGGAFAGTDSLALATQGGGTEIPMMDATGARVGSARISAEAAGGIRIALDVQGLPPGSRAFHIHENAQCDPPSFESAGGHFAPMGQAHGFGVPAGPHAGDMENLDVEPDGTFRGEMVNLRVSMNPDEPNSIFRGNGTALVIHADADDNRTQPSGGAGDRIACGVIRRG